MRITLTPAAARSRAAAKPAAPAPSIKTDFSVLTSGDYPLSVQQLIRQMENQAQKSLSFLSSGHIVSSLTGSHVRGIRTSRSCPSLGEQVAFYLPDRLLGKYIAGKICCIKRPDPI